MTDVAARWLQRSAGDVPPGDAWLLPPELAVQAGLRVPKRREDWRLGRWTAKCTVAAHLGLAPQEVAVVAAADGCPEPFVDGAPAGLSVSLSHRDGRAVAAVSPVGLGIDLEVIEPRNEAFVDEWYAPPERELVARTPAGDRPLLVNTIWTAKEAAAKVLREGLRLDVRQVVVSLGADAGPGTWQPCRVDLEGRTIHGWWRHDHDLVMCVATDPPAGEPVPLEP